MDENLRLNLLFDFYGDLLTEKQKQVFRYYYQEDLSLGEIAEYCGVTRQGVYDVIKRAERALHEIESKLQLLEKHLNRKKKLREAIEILGQLAESCPAAREKLDMLTDLMVDLLHY